MHLTFHKANRYQKIQQKNFLIFINKYIKILTGFSYFLKNNTEKEINKIIWLIEKNAKKYDKVIIEFSENNPLELNQKIMKKIEKCIFIFSDDLNEIKNTKEKIEK